MSSRSWQQIEELYHSACEHGISVLDGADPDIRKQVERLLSQSGGKLLDQSVADLIDSLTENSIAPGSQLGPLQN